MTLAAAFAVGWIFGLTARKVVRAVRDSDILGVLADCAAAWCRSHRSPDAGPLPSATQGL